MSIRKKTEEQLEEVYQSRLKYLNSENGCEELHAMCNRCEKYSGRKEHDFSECREMPCFKNWLGLEYLDWINGY